MTTSEQYKSVIDETKSLFMAKNADYGLSWRILRLPSITDQIAIKAKRIRNIQQTNQNHVGDSIFGEFIGIINYCTMALIQVGVGATIPNETLQAKLPEIYDTCIVAAYNTMLVKNADYGEAWREIHWGDIPFCEGYKAQYDTQKPIELLERIIKVSSNEGDVVADFFCDSGTTLAAANKLGRYYLGCDINPKAIKIAKERININTNLFSV